MVEGLQRAGLAVRSRRRRALASVSTLVASLKVAPAEAAEECGQCSEGIGNSSMEHRPLYRAIQAAYSAAPHQNSEQELQSLYLLGMHRTERCWPGNWQPGGFAFGCLARNRGEAGRRIETADRRYRTVFFAPSHSSIQAQADADPPALPSATTATHTEACHTFQSCSRQLSRYLPCHVHLDGR